MSDTQLLLNKTQIESTLESLAKDLITWFKDPEDVALMGIRTRGVVLAKRLQKKIAALTKKNVPLGILDITLYRDDLSALASQPVVHQTELDFDVTDKKVILVDDVVFTGRTIRAAIDQIIDFGRPKCIKLVALIDRGQRELPIQPDFVGKKVETSSSEDVQVRVSEIDGDEKVSIVQMTPLT